MVLPTQKRSALQLLVARSANAPPSPSEGGTHLLTSYYSLRIRYSDLRDSFLHLYDNTCLGSSENKPLKPEPYVYVAGNYSACLAFTCDWHHSHAVHHILQGSSELQSDTNA